MQVYLSIKRADLARKEFNRAAKWAEDDLLLQHIEASIGLVTGKDGYSNPHSYYSEQLGNPSLASSHLFTSRGVTYVLRNQIPEAQADFSEAMKSPIEHDAIAGAVAASALAAGKSEERDALLACVPKNLPVYPSKFFTVFLGACSSPIPVIRSS